MLISKKLLAPLAMLLFASPAQARIQSCDGTYRTAPGDLKLVCSATWQFSGTCTANDMWDQWEVTGQTKPDDAFIRPWADTPINVVGYELVKLQAGETGLWRPVSIGIATGVAELHEVLLGLAAVGRDVITFNWTAVSADRARAMEKIAAIQRGSEDKIALARYRNGDHSWFMIGSGIDAQPDAMLWLAPGENHVSRAWPAGAGQLWPSKTNAGHAKYGNILDLHGVCFGGGASDHPPHDLLHGTDRGAILRRQRGRPLVAIETDHSYIQHMPRKPIELPPAVARAFVKDMHAFHAGPNAIKREIASR